MARETFETIDAGDVVIVGAGLAGLFTALKLVPLRVTVLAAAPLGEGASSSWAQGGVAAALGPDDRPAAHAADTIAAGAGIVDPDAAQILAEEAAARIEDLARLGVPFDRDSEGRFGLGREAAHSHNRIVRVQGDRAGAAIMKSLIVAAKEAPSIAVAAGWRATDLALAEGRAVGVFARRADGKSVCFRARAVVLAAGGIGALYAVTTNPPQARGDALAMAARAGALIADPEFVQFHPTAIAIGRDPAPLATEALRGEGAILVNGRGKRFMLGCHADAELAPRDVVARAVHRQIRLGQPVFLDCREAIGAEFPARFPTVAAACASAGIDPVREGIPVAPAAHFHMGGIAIDSVGATTVQGLYACGETSSSGAHGANRLASNSLLDAVVTGARLAHALKAALPAPLSQAARRPVVARQRAGLPGDTQTLRRFFTDVLGLERSADGLIRALTHLPRFDQRPDAPNGNALTVGLLIAAAAYRRQESRGGHFRSDFPDADPRFAQRTFLTLEQAYAIAADATDAPVERGRSSLTG